MPRHVEAFMDSVPLSAIGPVIIQQIHEDAPSVEVSEATVPGRYGSRLISKQRTSLRVTIEAAIRELFDLRTRAAVMEQIAKWSQGRILELSTRPDRRLRVVCTGEPSLGAVRDYTATCRIELTAYEVPYWENRAVNTVSLSGAETAANIYVPGTVPSPVEVDIQPTGAALTTVTVTVGENTIQLTGLNVAAGNTLSFRRSENDVLIISCGEDHLLSHRTPESADDLMTPAGYSAFSLTANTACQVTVATRGRWA